MRQVHFVLGGGFQQADWPREAAAEYRKSLAINDHNGSVHNNLGLILFQQHHHAEARSEFLRAIELDETDNARLVNLALLTSELHEYENRSTTAGGRWHSILVSTFACRLIAVARGVHARLAETIPERRIQLMAGELAGHERTRLRYPPFTRFTPSRGLGLAVCLAALTLAVYVQVGRFGFIPIDDSLYVANETAHPRWAFCWERRLGLHALFTTATGSR